MIFRPQVAWVLALALGASVAHASDYTDFRIPAHSIRQFELSLAAVYSPSQSNSGPDQSRRHSGQFNTAGQWSRSYDSERLQHAIAISGAALGNSFREESRSTETVPFWWHTESDRDSRTVDEAWRLSAALRHYPTAAPWGWGGAISGGANYRQGWQSESNLSSNGTSGTRREDRLESWLYRYDVNASLFAGFGRVRDATGVQQVQFIEHRLLRDGVLDGPLQKETRQRLAELFYLQAGYSVVHDLPDRFFWAEFERILRTDPSFQASAFNAYAVMRASDPVVVAGRLHRPVGMFAGPVLSFRHENLVQRSDANSLQQYYVGDTVMFEVSSSSALRLEHDDQTALGGAQAEFERPLSMQWHLSAFGIAVSDLRGPDRYLEVRSALNLRYWGGERWYGEVRVDQFHASGDAVSSPAVLWDVSYGGSVSWFLEDHVSLTLGAFESQVKYAWDPYTNYGRDARVQLGLSYRRGALTAPGLVGRVRPVS